MKQYFVDILMSIFSFQLFTRICASAPCTSFATRNPSPMKEIPANNLAEDSLDVDLDEDMGLLQLKLEETKRQVLLVMEQRQRSVERKKLATEKLQEAVAQ